MSANESRPGWETRAANETGNSGDTRILQADKPPALEAALTFLAQGISVVPTRSDGSKAPAGPWKEYQERRAAEQELYAWFGGERPQYTAIGVVTGPVSGNLELAEIEGRAAHEMHALQELAYNTGLKGLWDRLCTGWLEQSPSGGYHFFYRLQQAPAGNTKLASRPATAEELAANPREKTMVLAETRGTGGYVVTAPSGGQAHPTGRAWTLVAGGATNIPTLTGEELEAFHTLLRTLHQPAVTGPAAAQPSPFAAVSVSQSQQTAAGEISPLDDFEARTDWADILLPAGWRQLYADAAGVRYWTRPGKTTGISATTGKDPARDRLFVFSSSTEFQQETPYTKQGAHAVIHHGGDHSAAASQLRKDGYGSPRPAARPQPADTPPAPAKEPLRAIEPMTLAQTHDVFRRWLGDDYDTDALDAVLAAAACNQLDGDPLWLLLLSGSGNAKTETVQALQASGATITSTISSVGALLSATSTKEKTKDATGGLLKKLGTTGVLVIKDVTSILSMDRTARGEVLGALREVHDGRWSRNVGTDGGRTLEWEGRLIVIGAVTTAWDRAHDVIASMGDRFVVVRMDSTKGRQAAGRQAIGNTGHEIQMRQELEAAASGALASVNPAAAPSVLTEQETEVLLEAANIVTLARTGVDYDYRGDVIDAHAPEMPTRFAKELAQVVRGGIALGMSRLDALRLAIRCARDSMPPLRLAILDDVAAHPYAATKDVRKRLGKPRATVDRQLQALHMLGVLTVEEEPIMHRGTDTIQWRYTVTVDIDPRAIDANSVPDLL